jgi:hypothetical protein
MILRHATVLLRPTVEWHCDKSSAGLLARGYGPDRLPEDSTRLSDLVIADNPLTVAGAAAALAIARRTAFPFHPSEEGHRRWTNESTMQRRTQAAIRTISVGVNDTPRSMRAALDMRRDRAN